jgi:tRNA-2-methylthio-N6-dimethylallyladenosine synthase
VTSFPRDFTDQALQAMRDCPRICRYLHVPAQSGSDRMLKMMNRGYSAGQYRDFIDRARERMPDVSLAGDFIVGFPTETEEDHQSSMELIRYARYKNSFIFKYSPRPGTAAIDRYEDDVPDEVKRRRNNEVLAVQQAVSAENNRQMIGRHVEVLVEGVSKLANKSTGNGAVVQVTLGGKDLVEQDDDRVQLVARTRGDQVVCFDGQAGLKGKLVNVEIVDAQVMTLFGRVLR